MNEQYYKELSRILARNGIETALPEKNTLLILLNGRSACRVEPSGDVCIFPDDLRSPEADELYHRVAPFSRMVKEYMAAIERAPLLQATALDEDYKLLAEFNGTVLAGRETEHGYISKQLQFHYWLFGHYHENRNIGHNYVLLWEQIVQVL